MCIVDSFDVLLPKVKFEGCWPVIACDQFTSQPEYWERVREIVGARPSAVHCIIPEAELSSADGSTYKTIFGSMNSYLDVGVFREYKNSFVYLERTLSNGEIRQGLVGVIDLEDYDYHSGCTTPIRATEQTVIERIPPRVKIRQGASLELSHVLLLCDDERFSIIEPLGAEVKTRLYDLNLMQGGGHVTGWLVDGDLASKVRARIDEYCKRKMCKDKGMVFAVGDGNHSLAAAKAYYEELKKTSDYAEAVNRARYAMVELENLLSHVQKFEPIHRLLVGVDVEKVLAFLKEKCGADRGYPVMWVSGETSGTIYLKGEPGEPPVSTLQEALDEYLSGAAGEIDYIHGEDALRALAARENTIGFILTGLSKDNLFTTVAQDGALPRKSFSIGEALDKRYYMEARKL